MTNKNAAPERIEYQEAKTLAHKLVQPSKETVDANDAAFIARCFLAVLNKYQNAMQPVPSESDEAVAQKIYGRCLELSLAGLGGDDGSIATILARHRQKPAENPASIKLTTEQAAQLEVRMEQPAQVHPRLAKLFADKPAEVSRSAEELVKDIVQGRCYEGLSKERLYELLQSALDAAKLEGVRLGLEAAAMFAQEHVVALGRREPLINQRAFGRIERNVLGRDNISQAAMSDAIRTLDPHTIIQGGK